MVWYFIGVYIINRTLQGCLGIQNFSSRVEKIFHLFAASLVKYFSTLEEKFRSSPRGHVIFSIYPPFLSHESSLVSYLLQPKEIPKPSPLVKALELSDPVFGNKKKCSKIAEKVTGCCLLCQKMITCKFLNISNSFDIIGIII